MDLIRKRDNDIQVLKNKYQRARQLQSSPPTPSGIEAQQDAKSYEYWNIKKPLNYQKNNVVYNFLYEAVSPLPAQTLTNMKITGKPDEVLYVPYANNVYREDKRTGLTEMPHILHYPYKSKPTQRLY